MTEEELQKRESSAASLLAVGAIETATLLLDDVREIRSLQGCRCETLDETEGGGTDSRSCPEHAFAAGVEHGRELAAAPPIRESLRAMRKAAGGLSQGAIAKILGVNQSDVSDLEARQDFKLSTLRAFATALKGRVRVLFDLPGRPPVELVIPVKEPKS